MIKMKLCKKSYILIIFLLSICLGINVHAEENLKENSWRYQNGELIEMLEDSPRMLYDNAWNYENGAYRNSIGEPILGAVKKGIDVSYAQGKIDWESVKNDGIDYVIIRCGYGDDMESQDDQFWEYNVEECERLGIPYGVYIYSYATTIAMAQSEANHVLRLIAGHKLSYPVYFDMEDSSTENISTDLREEIAQTFCNAITNAGYDVGIYANLYWWNTKLTGEVFNNTSWSKWVAQYSTECDYKEKYDMWQCTSQGRVNGIAGNVDIDFLIDYTYMKAPEAVTDLKAVSSGKEKVKLTWNHSVGADGYLIYAQKNGKYGYVGMTSNNYFIDLKALDIDYNFYWVFPYIGEINVNAMVGKCDKYVYAKGIIPAVTNLKASSVKGAVQLTWEKQEEADGYLIYGIVNGKKYGYVGMTTKGTVFRDTKASKMIYNYYWVYPYHTNSEGKMIIGRTPLYTYGRAL